MVVWKAAWLDVQWVVSSGGEMVATTGDKQGVLTVVTSVEMKIVQRA